jgi:chromosome segregation ATPase
MQRRRAPRADDAGAGVTDAARLRSSWLMHLDDDQEEGARRRVRAREPATVGTNATSVASGARARDGEAHARGRRAQTYAAPSRARPRQVRAFGAHVGGYDDVDDDSTTSDESEPPTPSDRAPPRAYVRQGTNGGKTNASTVAKLRALTKEAGHFREELAREKKRRNAAGVEIERSREEYEALKRAHAALTYSHNKLKQEHDDMREERARLVKGLKKKLTQTLEREARQRKKSVATLKMALEALRAFAPTAPSGKKLGGSAVSAVIAELASLTEKIALRDSLDEDVEDAAPVADERPIPSSWSISDMERTKARVEVLERELNDAYDVIRVAEKERVVLERELAAARRELDVQADAHDAELRAAAEATTRAIEMVRVSKITNATEHQPPPTPMDIEDTSSDEDVPSPRDAGPSTPTSTRDLRRDMDSLELELHNLQRTMADALASVETDMAR